MTVQLAPSPVFKAFDNNGQPLFNGTLSTFIAGSSTPQATYPDSTQTTPNTNPIILNQRGEANVWLVAGQTYKLVLKDSLGNVIWSVDNITGGLVLTQQVIGQLLYPVTGIETAAGVTVVAFQYPPGNVLRYGADPTGSVDSTTAIQGALNLNLNGGCAYQVIIPPGIFLTSGLTVSLANTYILGSTPSQNSLSACTILKGTGANTTVLQVASFVVGGLIKGLYFDRSVVATGGAGLFIMDEVTIDIENCKAVNQFYGFLLGATNFARIYNCQAELNYSIGFFITQLTTTITPLQWVLDTCLSQENNLYGFCIQANHDNGSGHGTVDPRFNACGTFANGLIGWFFNGSVAHNDLTAVDCYSSFDGQAGWAFENTGTSIELIGCFAEGTGLQATGRNLSIAASHVGAGLLFETSGDTTGFVNIIGFISRQNSFQGIAVASNAVFARMSLVNCQCIDNGQFGNAFGIDLEEPTTIFLLSGCSSNNEVTSNQVHGIQAANASHVYLAACDFSNNASGGTGATTGTYNAAACNGVPFFASPALVSGWGTPTGNSVTANFSGSAAPLTTCSAAIAEIITVLKSAGILGA